MNAAGLAIPLPASIDVFHVTQRSNLRKEERSYIATLRSVKVVAKEGWGGRDREQWVSERQTGHTVIRREKQWELPLIRKTMIL